MLAEFVPGDRVIHARYGPGQILAVFPRGRARVRFDRRRLFPITVTLAELAHENHGQEIAPKREVPAPSAPPRAVVPPRTPLTRDQAVLRQVIEALRLGVVPHSHVGDYTVGREKALRRIDQLLSSRQGLELIFGDYGAGKTHLLDLVEQMARQRGFVTARVVLDPNEVPLAHPQRLWRAIITSLRHPGGGEGLVPILERLAQSADHFHPDGARFSRFLSPVLHAWRVGNAEVWGWAADYIEGYRIDPDDLQSVLRRWGWRGPRPLALPDFRTYGQVYVHLVGTVACWAADAGASGLCLLLDEAEQVESFDRRHRELSAEVLGQYAAATLPLEELGFDPDQLYRGGQEVHRKLPRRFDPEQPLAVVMALTPLPEIYSLARRLVRRPEIVLKPLSAGDKEELARRVISLYARAYPRAGISGPVLSRLVAAAERPRALVREIIAELDARRYGLSRA